jgi:hypothetical protein
MGEQWIKEGVFSVLLNDKPYFEEATRIVL